MSTVPQERVVPLDDIVVEVQHLQNDGGAGGLCGDTRINVATCRWQKGPKGSNKRILTLTLMGRGRKKYYWCVKEDAVKPKVRDGCVHLSAEGMPNLMLRLPAFAQA
jgi:hypothetical protein